MHSWELVTAVDGPGTRMTTFLAGCPLRCLYCHNPDTMTARNGVPVLADDLLARIKRYRGVFRATGGGITLSGGEVLMQPAFARRILRGAKQWGIHTALDTSGFLGANADDDLLADVDLVLLDVKAGDEATYHRVTGRRLAPTLEFGRRLSDLGIETWIRFVLVPGLTDNPDTVAPIADYAASLATVSRVEVLPFHQMGRDKWADLGLTYELDDTAPPSPELVESTRAIFRERGLTAY
ncbi:MAG: pyruvate formate-lyase-activating protein [Propioniciclava sp.]